MANIPKTTLKTELLQVLRDELAAAENAHRTTAAGATHAEAKPENDKDTRALEQSYLARGQAARVEELRAVVAEVGAMRVTDAAASEATLGACVTVEDDARRMTYWVALHGGGARLAGGRVQVVTPRSPLGRALIGKLAGDDAEVVLGGKTRTLRIVSVE